jgi:hypothetical protein
VKFAARSELNLHSWAHAGATQIKLSKATRKRWVASVFMRDDFLCIK